MLRFCLHRAAHSINGLGGGVARLLRTLFEHVEALGKLHLVVEVGEAQRLLANSSPVLLGLLGGLLGLLAVAGVLASLFGNGSLGPLAVPRGPLDQLGEFGLLHQLVEVADAANAERLVEGGEGNHLAQLLAQRVGLGVLERSHRLDVLVPHLEDREVGVVLNLVRLFVRRLEFGDLVVLDGVPEVLAAALLHRGDDHVVRRLEVQLLRRRTNIRLADGDVAPGHSGMESHTLRPTRPLHHERDGVVPARDVRGGARVEDELAPVEEQGLAHCPSWAVSDADSGNCFSGCAFTDRVRTRSTLYHRY